MTNPPPSRRPTGLRFDKSLLSGSTLHQNLTQEIILTTSDKMRLHLRSYESGLRASMSWTTPLSILISLLAALVVTTEFKETFGIGKEVWHAAFLLSSIGSFIWFLISSTRAVISKYRKQTEIEHIVKYMITQSKTTEL
jgi:hypothetical protein